MATSDDKHSSLQYSEDQLYTICLHVAEKLQAFYLSGSTSKYPRGLSLEEFVQKGIKDEL